MARPFSEKWEEILKNNVQLYNRLPEDLKKQLHRFVNVFIAEKNFEGCGGIEMSDEIRVTVAGQACILLLNRRTRFYPHLKSILVYPGAYFAQDIKRIGSQIIKKNSTRLGESWSAGVVVLSWDDTIHGAVDYHDGHNVVLHEFAHQLDEEDGFSNGLPMLENAGDYIRWSRILSREYRNLREGINQGYYDVIDDYGASNPAEFFAVATETFFELPNEMKSEHAELYEAFMGYYKVDPSKWKGYVTE